MTRQPRGLIGRKKLQAITEAARRIVLTEGLSQAKMSDIATEAKVSTATVYAYFPSKADLFRAVVEAVALEVEAEMAADMHRAQGDPIEALARVFLARLNDGKLRALFRIFAVEGPKFPEALAIFDTRTRKRAHEAAVALFEKLAGRGRFAPDSAEVAARQLIGMLEHETLILGILCGDDAALAGDNAEIARQAAKTVWARFGLDPAAPGRIAEARA